MGVELENSCPEELQICVVKLENEEIDIEKKIVTN